MKKISALMIVAALAMAMPSIGYAEPSAWKNEQGYTNQAVAKFRYGFKNVILGWTEIFSEPGKDTENLTTVSKGIFRGLEHGVLNTVGGALHLVTFVLPQVDVPLPHQGVNV